MISISIIRPPFVFSKHAFSKPVVPPLGVAYLASSLRASGHRVQVVDALGESLLHTGPSMHPQLMYQGLSIEDIVLKIHPGTNAIGISSMFSLEWPHTGHLIHELHGAFPELPIILGGEHATATYEYILKKCPEVFCIVLGEGEETLCEIADHLDGKRDLESIKGIAYCKNGAIIKTSSRARQKKLDDLPLPAWDLIPLHFYHTHGYTYGVNLGKSMPILATRGCPYQCTFCSNPLMWGARYYMRTPSKVVDEIEMYLNIYQATNIDFYDLTAILKREWILEFCHEVIKRNLQFTWQLPVGTRSEALDKEVLRSLYVSGCRNICYAPESGSERILQDIKKKVHLKRLNQSIQDAIETGMHVKVNLLIGFPGETRLDMVKTFFLMLKYAFNGIDDAGLFSFSPYPGSELYRYLREKKVIQELNNDYFASLAAFMDFTTPISYCEKVSAFEINCYRILGMALFYILAYLRKPIRIVRTFKNLWLNQSETVFEQRVLDFAKRSLHLLSCSFPSLCKKKLVPRRALH